ncbi:MAG: DUF1573 domain-containing protein [Bacteroidales bacterium]
MKIFLLALALAGFNLVVLAQNTETATEQTAHFSEIYFEKSVHDYGTIAHNSNGLYEFEFENKGTAPLLITHATSSCGCTVPDYPKTPFAPGEKGKIAVRYDTKRIGAFHKSVTLRTNAKNAPSVMLYIKGEVKHITKEEDALPK